jgi:hypothetical protein
MSENPFGPGFLVSKGIRCLLLVPTCINDEREIEFRAGNLSSEAPWAGMWFLYRKSMLKVRQCLVCSAIWCGGDENIVPYLPGSVIAVYGVAVTEDGLVTRDGLAIDPGFPLFEVMLGGMSRRHI